MAAEVKFVRLQCLETEDNGADELYLHYNGAHLAGIQDVETGGTWQLDLVKRLDGEAFVSLFDEDDIDEDDFLGEIVISESEMNQGLRQQEFNQDDALYVLFYRVRPFEED
ncbi:hypothetical protein GCM10011579_092530 [Streptomyces albiflavescens]|uniref:Uncharacterized protein n=1 Tax=Streptomyces albiflavescens TaxID=1623582 RepID=A0A918DAI9_9ACTN|nr:hypothetical protein [Streptomyces albiflavescens]GGN93746.1 hypothetical protein GCM10011579_092530 [Streptomyces albiflavescens]